MITQFTRKKFYEFVWSKPLTKITEELKIDYHTIVALCKKHDITPMLGCEFYLVKDRHQRQFTREKKDRRFSQVLYAKNQNGYYSRVEITGANCVEFLDYLEEVGAQQVIKRTSIEKILEKI